MTREEHLETALEAVIKERNELKKDYNSLLEAYNTYCRPYSEWIKVSIKPPIGVGDVLLKTSSGLVTIGDLYEGKWRIMGHWSHNGKEWVSTFRYEDIIEWRHIPDAGRQGNCT